MWVFFFSFTRSTPAIIQALMEFLTSNSGKSRKKMTTATKHKDDTADCGHAH